MTQEQIDAATLVLRALDKADPEMTTQMRACETAFRAAFDSVVVPE